MVTCRQKWLSLKMACFSSPGTCLCRRFWIGGAFCIRVLQLTYTSFLQEIETVLSVQKKKRRKRKKTLGSSQLSCATIISVYYSQAPLVCINIYLRWPERLPRESIAHAWCKIVKLACGFPTGGTRLLSLHLLIWHRWWILWFVHAISLKGGSFWSKIPGHRSSIFCRGCFIRFHPAILCCWTC